MTSARSDLNPILTEIFRHNLWANLSLIDLCATLPEDVLETNVPGTFGTIRETLGHLAGTEEGYLAGLVADIESDSSSDKEAGPNLATLRERALQSGEVRGRTDHLRGGGCRKPDRAGGLVWADL